MKIKQFTISLAYLYGVELFIYRTDNGKEIQFENPRILEAEKWLDDHFLDGERLQSFYDYFILKFKKSGPNPYPLPSHFQDIYIEFREATDERPNTLELPSPKEIGKIFSERNDVDFKNEMTEEYLKNPEKVKKQMAIDDNNISSINMMKKYSVLLCMAFWSDGMFNLSKKFEESC